MPAYRILVADLLTGTIREEVPLSSFSYETVLNRPGSFSGSIGLRHPKAARSNLDPARTAVHVEREGAIVWSGIMWAARADLAGDRLGLAGEGWWSYFRRRHIREDRIYDQVDQLTIAQDLVTYAQGILGGDLGIIVGTETSGVLRDRTYSGYERKPVGEAVEQLSEVDNGFDFAVESAWEAGEVVSRLRFNYPRRGRDTRRVLEVGTNVEALGQDIDGIATANLIDALGAGEGDAQLIATAQDTSQLSVYPLLEDIVAYKDVSVPATLQGHADLALINRARPQELIPNCAVRQDNPDAAVGGLIAGDTVTVRGTAGWLRIDALMRIMAINVSVDEEGREDVTLTFAPEEITI